MKLLLEKGAACYLPDKNGTYPIDLAGWKNHKDVVQLLIEKALEMINEKRL